ncbi:MAG: hypothetical protein V2A54_11150 [Bacteroidota bacterium]
MKKLLKIFILLVFAEPVLAQKPSSDSSSYLLLGFSLGAYIDIGRWYAYNYYPKNDAEILENCYLGGIGPDISFFATNRHLYSFEVGLSHRKAPDESGGGSSTLASSINNGYKKNTIFFSVKKPVIGNRSVSNLQMLVGLQPEYTDIEHEYSRLLMPFPGLAKHFQSSGYIRKTSLNFVPSIRFRGRYFNFETGVRINTLCFVSSKCNSSWTEESTMGPYTFSSGDTTINLNKFLFADEIIKNKFLFQSVFFKVNIYLNSDKSYVPRSRRRRS